MWIKQGAGPVVRLGVLGEGQVGIVEGLNCPNVLPVAVIQVGLYMHPEILGTRNDFTAKVIRLHVAYTAEAHTCQLH